MKPHKIKCSNPHCDDYLSEDEIYYCEICDKPYCLSCYMHFEQCESCLTLGCENCIKCDEISGFYFCDNECKEEFLDNE